MIVGAIIGILAAITIPNRVDMQHREDRAEVPSSVDGIKTAEPAYEASFDVFIQQPPLLPPRSSPNRPLRAWTTGSAVVGHHD